MNLELNLPDLPRPNLSEAVLRRPLAVLAELKTRNEERWGTGGGTKAFEDRKEKLRSRLQNAVNPSVELQEILERDESGLQRLLLSIYIESHGQDWLPAFEEDIAACILGHSNGTWKRLAAILFFTKFDSLPALLFLSTKLRSAFSASRTDSSSSGTIWATERDVIFQIDGPERIAKSARRGETFHQLAERYAIPEKGAYSVMLRRVLLLKVLQHCPYGEVSSVLYEIEADREKLSVDALCLGAAALRILVNRVEHEAQRKWPEKWREWILRLGCDPRLGRHTAEAAKWWGWATDSQWKLAVQGIIGRSLKLFFDFLDGTVTVDQWEQRREFLDTLFDQGKIMDARLVLNSSCMQRLPSEMKDGFSTALLHPTSDNTSVIALRCTDDIYLIEGTHNFGLRAFHRTFPVERFWEECGEKYADSDLRISPQKCPVFIAHQRDWVYRLQDELRRAFHVEWNIS